MVTMKLAIIILNVILGLGASDAVTLAPRQEVFHFKGLDGKTRDYNIAEPTIVGLVNGVEFSFNGTAQQYVAAAKKLDPTFDIKSVKKFATRAAEMDLEKRTVIGRLCIPIAGQGWTKGVKFTLEEGVAYLDGLNRRVYVDGRTCSRISCSYGSAIWMCNDNTWGVYPASWFLSDIALEIVNLCVNSNRVLTGGQIFDSSGFNLILREDHTNGCGS